MESILFRIMNLKGLHSLEEEIEKMSDEKERDARLELIEQIMERITDYDVHVRAYAYQQTVQAMNERGIVFEPADKEPIVTEWDSQFDSLVSAEVKQSTQHYTKILRLIV